MSEAFLFYRNSTYHTGVGGSVANAIDPINDGANPDGKDLLKSGATTQATTFVNVSNYSRGINGLVFDINSMPASSLTTSDFVFRRPTNITQSALPPKDWTGTVPAPTAIAVTVGTPSRVRIEWADNAFRTHGYK